MELDIIKPNCKSQLLTNSKYLTIIECGGLCVYVLMILLIRYRHPTTFNRSTNFILQLILLIKIILISAMSIIGFYFLDNFNR